MSAGGAGRGGQTDSRRPPGPRTTARRRIAPAAVLLLGGLAALAACRGDVQGPDEAGPAGMGSLTVAASFEADSSRATARTLSAAFDSADRVGLRLIDPSDESAVEELEEPFDPSEGTAEVQVETRVEGDSASFGLDLALLRGEDPLFSASRTVVLRAGATTTAEVTLEPEAAGVRAPSDSIVLAGARDTTRVEGAVLFATGDTVPTLSPTWTSRDPAVVTAGPDGLLTAQGAGRTRVVASFEEHADSVRVRVEEAAADTSARLEGRVVTAQGGSGVQGVTVSFTPIDSGSTAAIGASRVSGQVATATTGSDGTWTSPGLSPGTYDIGFDHPERENTTLFGAEAAAERQSSVGQVPLAPASQQVGAVSGTVSNARDGTPVSGADLELREGVNANSGAAAATTTTDETGAYRFAEQPAGTYTVTAVHPDFADGSRTVAVVGGTELTGRDLALSPTGSAGEVRIVLSWGETPSDLDAHLTGPDGSGGRFHVYFANPGSLDSSPFAALDRDDTSSFGPETITITQVRDGVYRYSVHDFTNRGATPDSPSSALAQSGARVEVFVDGSLAAEFFPPNEDGNLWTVFELEGSAVTAVDTMGYESSSGAIGSVAPAGTTTVGKPHATDGSEQR